MQLFPSRSIKLLAILGLLAFTALCEAGDERRSAKKLLTEAQCERLVDQLVNPGKRPFNNSVLDLPDGVTTSILYKKQKGIATAYNELSDKIEVSLPTLMKHIDDQRFSYVYEEGISGSYHAMDVGGACYRIITAHVDVYREAVTKYDSDGRSNSIHFIDIGEGGINRWWKERHGRTLADLQLEGINWALRHPKPDYFSESEWASAKRSLKKMSVRIVDSKKPILVEHHVRFFPR